MTSIVNPVRQRKKKRLRDSFTQQINDVPGKQTKQTNNNGLHLSANNWDVVTYWHQTEGQKHRKNRRRLNTLWKLNGPNCWCTFISPINRINKIPFGIRYWNWNSEQYLSYPYHVPWFTNRYYKKLSEYWSIQKPKANPTWYLWSPFLMLYTNWANSLGYIA